MSTLTIGTVPQQDAIAAHAAADAAAERRAYMSEGG